MSDLHRALGDIRSIRRQLADATQFRGYGPATLAVTAVLAMLAAAAQAYFLPDPVHHMRAYLSLWISTATVSAGSSGVQMFRRTRRMHSGLSNEMMRVAVEQFVPCVAVGMLLTCTIMLRVPTVAWTLPGLWQVLFSLGIFSSCRFLPREVLAVGAWYLVSGLAALSLGDARALAPWTMGLGFGAGQMLVAGVLLASAREANHEG